MTSGRRAQIYWFGFVVLLAFGVPETIAVLTHHVEFTFSASWWSILGTYAAHPAFRWERVAISTAFFGTLWAHFALGLKAKPWLFITGGAVAALALVSMFVLHESPAPHQATPALTPTPSVAPRAEATTAHAHFCANGERYGCVPRVGQPARVPFCRMAGKVLVCI